jgi:hypothetical protein
VVNPGLHHFEFGEIASPQTAGAPFQVTIAACDFFGDTVDAFSQPAGIWDLTGAMTPAPSITFSGGLWSGEATINSVIAWDVITCGYDDGTKALFTGSSNGFEIRGQMGASGEPVLPVPAVRTFNARVSPNPVRGRAEIELQLPREGRVEVSVFNILGQKVMSRDIGSLPAGIRSLPWQFEKNLNPGVYFFTITMDGGNRLVRKASAVR